MDIQKELNQFSRTRIPFPIYVSDHDVSVIRWIQARKPHVSQSQRDQKGVGESFDNHYAIRFYPKLERTIIFSYFNGFQNNGELSIYRGPSQKIFYKS